MALSEFDRELLDKCLKCQPGSWEHLTDRFAGLIMAVVTHVANSRDIRTTVLDREDIVARIFEKLIEDDFRVLRNFRGNSSLYTYFTVISRRIAVRELIKLDKIHRKELNSPEMDVQLPVELKPDNFEELVASLDEESAELLRLRYVKDLPYSEIAKIMNIAENSIGPLLSRARAKIKKVVTDS